MKNQSYFAASPQPVKIHVRQSGFSLIELMIAMVVGLFLMAAILGVMMSFNNSFKTQDSLSKVQDSARFVMTTLDNTVHLTGYYVFADPVTTTLATAFPIPAVVNGDGTAFAQPGQTIIGKTGTSSDSFNVRVQTAPNDGLVNCQGDTNTTGANITWTNSYAVNAANQLTCAVSINGQAFATPTILIDNVASMKVLYGVDTNPLKDYDKIPSIDTYLPAESVTDWSTVLSVKITIQFLDLVNSKPGVPVNLPYSMLHTVSIMNKT